MGYGSEAGTKDGSESLLTDLLRSRKLGILILILILISIYRYTYVIYIQQDSCTSNDAVKKKRKRRKGKVGEGEIISDLPSQDDTTCLVDGTYLSGKPRPDS